MRTWIFFAVVATYAGYWNVFTKAGIPGWKCLIPIYNAILMLRLVDRPDWWLFLLLIPLVNIVFGVVIQLELAERFGKSMGFGAGLALLPFIFYPILGFGPAIYYPPHRNS